MIIEIVRLDNTIFGALLINHVPFCVTLERPWKGNQKNISCIYEGHFACKKAYSPKFGNTYEVTNVDGRENILFHEGNYISESRGCILLGESFHHEKQMILNSKKTMGRFMERLHGVDSFELRITRVCRGF